MLASQLPSSRGTQNPASPIKKRSGCANNPIVFFLAPAFTPHRAEARPRLPYLLMHRRLAQLSPGFRPQLQMPLVPEQRFLRRPIDLSHFQPPPHQAFVGSPVDRTLRHILPINRFIQITVQTALLLHNLFSLCGHSLGMADTTRARGQPPISVNVQRLLSYRFWGECCCGDKNILSSHHNTVKPPL